MSSIILDQNSTEFTETSNKIEVQKKNGKSFVFQIKNSYKKLTNVDQLNHIINYLVLTSGYLMNNQSNNLIKFDHPLNSNENICYYEYYPREMIMNKFEKKLLSEVSL